MVTADSAVRLLRRPLGLFLVLVAVGFALRVGYGVVRYQRSDRLSLTGPQFVSIWDYDALEHVLIARALIDGKGYVVDESPGLETKHIRTGDALFKAPLYQFFLAVLFGLGGFSFAALLPVQALIGGVLSGLTGLVALEVFSRRSAAWIAGIIAASHPVLVNSASQPYNENLFFCGLMASVWAFIKFLQNERVVWAVASGALIGLTLLTRETAIGPLAAMILMGVVAARRRPRVLKGVVAMVLVAAALVVPWTVHNYLRLGIVVPIASAAGYGLAMGNNECVARESLWTPFWGEGRCDSMGLRRAQLLARLPASDRGSLVWTDRINAKLGRQFISDCPECYLRLVFRRAWSVLLPFHPRTDQGVVQRTGTTVYWLLVIPVGFAGAVLSLRRPRERTVLLGLLILASLAPLVAVYFSPDMRYRVGADLFLGCFAAWCYSEIAQAKVGTTLTPSFKGG